MFLYFQILGLPVTADDQAIRARYLTLAKQHPPEKDPETFKKITRAFERIKDRRTRIETQIFGTREYHFRQDALEDLMSTVTYQKKTPGLKQLIQAEKNGIG